MRWALNARLRCHSVEYQAAVGRLGGGVGYRVASLRVGDRWEAVITDCTRSKEGLAVYTY